jgi:hypothetical protein
MSLLEEQKIQSLDESQETVRLEPLKMAWITDFTIVCPDRDILVVKECIMRASKPLAAAIEDDNSCNSLSIKWRSTGIKEVMRCIHAFPGYSTSIDLVLNAERFVAERNIVEFCFQYDIEPLLSSLKTQMISRITKDGCNVSWLYLFHKFKNPEGKEPFKEQIDSFIRTLAMTGPNKSIEKYLALTYHPDDMLTDYRTMIMALMKLSSKGTLYGTIGGDVWVPSISRETVAPDLW